MSQLLASRCDQGLDVLFRRQLCNLLQFVEVFRLEIGVTPEHPPILVTRHQGDPLVDKLVSSSRLVAGRVSADP